MQADLWRNTSYGILVILFMNLQGLYTMSLAPSVYLQELTSVLLIDVNL